MSSAKIRATVPETARVKYVFLDVVGFTDNRSVEAQTHIVDSLNAICLKSLQELSISRKKRVLIPTGDGLAIAIFDVVRFDIHLRLALSILHDLVLINMAQADEARRFEVRIAVNENDDNVIRDINQKRNVAGSGIALARRILDSADGGQIMVGPSVQDALSQREFYLASFRDFYSRDKHGKPIRLFQFIGGGFQGLNTEIPSIFASFLKQARLTPFIAYYLAHASRHRDYLISRKDDPVRNETSIVLLYLLAKQSVEDLERPEHDTSRSILWRAGDAEFSEQYNYYGTINFWVNRELSLHVIESFLKDYRDCFDVHGEVFRTCTFWLASKDGLLRLKSEWPTIANEFAL